MTMRRKNSQFVEEAKALLHIAERKGAATHTVVYAQLRT